MIKCNVTVCGLISRDAMGTAIHPSIHDVTGLVILCVAPLNLIKGGLVSLITVLIYKRLSPILKTASRRNP